MRLNFHTLDVFTDTRFAGNPLGVVLNADALSAAQMQTIAREFNLSETVFVLAPEIRRTRRGCEFLRPRPSCHLLAIPLSAQRSC
jgi:PhzF family phenazine biosynthesis protein